jgi:hypothetical protein
MASKTRILFTDARHALRHAYAESPAVVAYALGGWTVYPPTETAPQCAVPEILVLAPGRLPLPLTEDGDAVWASIIRDALYQRPYRLTACAQERWVIEAICSGICMSLFQASQQGSTMAS